MINSITEEILKHVKKSDYQKGSQYDEDYIQYIGVTKVDKNKRHQFLVESESSYRKYMVQVEMCQNKIESTYCTCPQFEIADSCKHVAACCILYSDKLFSFLNEQDIEYKSQYILKKINDQLKKSYQKKQEVFLTPMLAIEDGYYRNYVSLKVKIGIGKKYSFLGKYSGFMSAYQYHESFTFGSSFTFDPDEHYFSEQSLRLLDLIDQIRKYSRINGNTAYLNERNIKDLFHIYPDGITSASSEAFMPLIQDFPVQVNFSKKDSKYKMIFPDDLGDVFPLTSDLEYVLYQQKIYRLNPQQQLFLRECMESDLQELIFPESQFSELQKTVIRTLKDHLVLDESTKDVIIDTKPEVSFYFDLNEDDITCVPKFQYKNKEISYFDEVADLVRDVDYEEETVNELYTYGFHKMSHFFLLDDFDLVCEFMDGGLDEISEKYSVFTSEKLKDTHILKKNTVTTTFHIGQDHILHYDFDLGAISSDEIDKIMNSLNQKKKYYRLKSGDILSLEEESLKELHDLSEDLELSLSDMKEGSGVLPKYRALYLDSLKQKKYGIIKTDSMFQQFIKQFEEYQNVELSFSKEELDVLRDYQVDGVRWLYTICKCGFGGILADEMGLGKSIQTIIFFKKLLEEDKDAKFLIVCPTSLVYNWENEFQKFASEISHEVFSGMREARRRLLESYTGSVYITSYGLLREDADFYQSMNFKVFVIDEAQNIKNPTTGLTKVVKSILAETKMALTGTPIENSIVELWSIFDFIMPGFLSSLVKFQKKYKVKEFDEETNQLLDRLRMQVKPFILRRKKSDVVKDLPEKIENNIYIDLNDEQKKIYAAEVKYVNEQMDQMIKQGGFTKNKMLILRLLTRLRQVCIDPAILFSEYHGGSSKIENLIKVIKEVVSNGHKILLFTSFKTALYIVKDALDEEGISNYTIDGDVPSKKRQMLVDAFNKDTTNVFLIMLKSGGTGLNLTSADVVIHLDLWWNPQAENQATDRTHRIGQTKTVEVIKLICKGTIEEKILDLQQKKKILSDKILESELDDSSYLKQLTEKDIRSLLAYENQD